MELAAGPGLTNGRRVVRALAVALFGSGLALSGARVIGSRFEPILLVPVAMAVLIGWVAARLALVLRAFAQMAAFIGSAMIVAYSSDGTAADVMRGLLNGPRQVVTTSWPSPRFPTILVAVAALISVAVAVGVDLAMRIHRRALAIVPLVVAFVAMVAIGAPDGPQWAPLLCVVAAVFTLLWIGLDDRVAGVKSGAAAAVAIGLAAVTVTVLVALTPRADPRHGADARRELSLLDPLADVAAQRSTRPAQPVYSVESSALPRLSRWRTAALDVYDGESWTTSGRLTPTGTRLGGETGADQLVVRISTLNPDTVLWALPGSLLRTSDPVETDPQRRVVRILGDRPADGQFTIEPLTAFDPSTGGALPKIVATEIESSYSVRAAALAGSGTLAEQIATLATTLHDDYKFNSGTPGGVQQPLIDRFLRDTKVGNLEQFVTSFVLMARSLGVDARVATGYQLDAQVNADTISTDDAIAWPEVLVAGRWVAVDVLPEDSNVAPTAQSSAGQPDTPPAALPPDPPQVDEAQPNEPVETAAPTEKSSAWSTARVWALRGALFVGLLLWPLVMFGGIVAWKKLRRRRGLKSTDPFRRVTTAWTLATDALVDAGATLHHSHTNAQLVEVGAMAQPAAGPPLGRLQRHADAVTFASAMIDPGRADDAVAQLQMIEISIRNSSSRWWRWKWWLSIRSLRRRTQSPLR